MSDSNRGSATSPATGGGVGVSTLLDSQSPQSSQSPPSPASSSHANDATTSPQQPPATSSSAPPPPPSLSSPSPSPSPSPQPTTSSSSPPPAPTTAPASSAAPAPSPSSTSSPVAPSTQEPPSSNPPAPSSSTPNQASQSVPVVTVTPSNAVTTIQVVKSIAIPSTTPPSSASKVSSTSTPAPINPGEDGSGGGLGQPAKVAIGVVVPIAAIALLALFGLWWWRKRKARQESEEERRKEVEDYSYNPNADPTIPAVGMAPDSYEMREDEGTGYRGWGSTTAAGSMGRKASTTMSGGMTTGAFSDGGGQNRGHHPDAKTTDPNADGSSSPEGEILGAMGPSAANNRGGDVRRGPSNASSSYSATGRSEGSDGGMYPNGGTYYDQYGQNPYGDQRPQELAGQAVIRDNPARRNTRIENPSHYPQQSAGIAQNF